MIYIILFCMVFYTQILIFFLWVVQRNWWEGCEVQSVVLWCMSFWSSHDKKWMGYDQVSYCSWVCSCFSFLWSFIMCLYLYIWKWCIDLVWKFRQPKKSVRSSFCIIPDASFLMFLRFVSQIIIIFLKKKQFLVYNQIC